MPVSQGFWSYVHDDDHVEGHRISELATDVAGQYRLLTGEKIELFRDKEQLRWGEDWKLRIDEVLADATFFIPVITPRYFQRPECRRELDTFARRAVDLGVQTLVLPIVYRDFPGLHEKPSGDPLIALVQQFTWADWTDLRFTTRDSPEYRRAVANLAEHLAAASSEAERVPLPAGPEDDAPGYLDVLATTEETMPAWIRTTDAINAKLTEIGVIMQRLAAGPGSLTERVRTATMIANALARPVADLQHLAHEFVVRLHDMDQGVRLVLARAQHHVAANPDLTDPIARFTADLRALVDDEVRELTEAEPLIEIITEIERGTRTLRPVARSLRRSMTLLTDGRDLMTAWSAALDRLPPPLDGR